MEGIFWLLAVAVALLAVLTAKKLFSKTPPSSGLAPSLRATHISSRPNLPPRPTAPSGPAPRWIHKDQAVEVAGYYIPGGMIYVGSGLAAVGAYGAIEPALIDPRLPVDRGSPDRACAQMPYWPSYSSIPPGSRAAYLDWLAGGRRDPSIGIGHVFLFFYGLERRALVDAANLGDAKADLPGILEEIRGLLAVYGRNGSFQNYATSFLDFVTFISVGPTGINLTAESSIVPGLEFPLSVRLALGYLSVTGKPIPADWALIWYRSAPSTRLRTPAQRCPEELLQLFSIRYAERFGGGLVVKPNRAAVRASYRPASSSFGGRLLEVPLTHPGAKVPIPDVTALQGPLSKIAEVAEACVTDLEAYSRWIGRNPELQSTAAAIALLPADLAKSHKSETISALCADIEGRLGTSSSAPIPLRDLLESWHQVKNGTLCKSDAVLLSQLLEKRGYGLEPDPRFGGPLPAADRTGIVFRLPPGSPSAPSPSLAAATLTLQLAVAVAAADDELSPAEIGELEEHLVTALKVTPQEQTRLEAHLKWLIVEIPSAAGLKKRIDALGEVQRQAIGEFVASVATADGRVTPAEVSTLTRIFKLLQLDPKNVYGLIHALSTSGATVEAPAAAPVTVRTPRRPQTGFAIPRGAESTPHSNAGVALDMARVEVKLAQSAAVSALLSSIFVDEEEQTATLPSAESDHVGSLDSAHSAFLRALTNRGEWSRSDLEALASELGVLPDGAVDAVNEYAIDRAGEPLCEGEDPIVVNRELAKELTL